MINSRDFALHIDRLFCSPQAAPVWAQPGGDDTKLHFGPKERAAAPAGSC